MPLYDCKPLVYVITLIVSPTIFILISFLGSFSLPGNYPV